MATTQKDILERILNELDSVKTKLPNGELKRIETELREIKEDYSDLKSDVSDIKYTLLNPEDGVIVRVNKNTDYRADQNDKQDYYDSVIADFERLKDWKEGVTKALWILFTAMVGVVGWIIKSNFM